MKNPAARRTAGRLVVGMLLVALWVSPAAAAYSNGPKIPPALMAKFKKYDSRYYVFYSDLPPDKVELAIARMTSVAELYNERTKGFGGKITHKFPFFMIANGEDYRAAGGEAYGCCWADRLMAWDTPAQAAELWHIIQHEAFHQFSHNVISEDLPGWVDEGMAEYFGESLWTGDGLVCGILPAKRYARIVPRAKEGRIKPFKDIIKIKSTAWAGIDDYDQAMTMIHFFVHEADGKYQKSLNNYIKMTAGGAPWDQAFAKCFGRNIDAVQKEYTDWLAWGPQAEADRAYTQATVQTLASFLARASSQGQKFASADEFLKSARDGSLKTHPKQPLPDELLKETLDKADPLKTWSLDVPGKGLPKLVLTLDDGTTFTATFTLKNGKVDKVKVAIQEEKPAQKKEEGGGEE